MGKPGRRNITFTPVLHDIANTEQTSFELRELLMTHLCLRGNAYSMIEYDAAGKITALWPLNPDTVSILREAGTNTIWYDIELPDAFNREHRILPYDRVWHLHGLGTDGIVGLSPISLARQAIGLAIATEEYGARFFGNGAQPGFVLKHPSVLSDDAYKRLKKSWEARHMGLNNAHKMAILEEGMTVEKLGVAPEDAQFLETRKFQNTEIARMFRVPPHMIADLDRATFSNIEHQGIEFVTHTIRPWLVRIEQGITKDLLTPSERKIYYAEFLVDALLRGDTQSRYASYAIGRNGGWLSTNDIRYLENMNPVDGGGDVYLVPLNMVPVDQVVSGEVDKSQDSGLARSLLGASDDTHSWRSLSPAMREERSKKGATSRHRLMNSYRKVYQSLMGRIISREVRDIKDGLKKSFGSRDYGQFSIWMDEFYREFPEYLKRQVLPVAHAYGDLVAAEAGTEVDADVDPGSVERFMRAYVDAYVGRHCGKSQEKIRKVITRAQAAGSDPVPAIEAELDEWNEKRPNTLANEEATRAANAVTKMVYLAAGVQAIRWFSFNKSCDYCSSLDGKVVGIRDLFLSAGESLQPDGMSEALKTSHDIGHPPVHTGCDCMIGAA